MFRKTKMQNVKAFVYIITGGINSGKTSELLSIYRRTGQGDGFINVKIYKAGLYIGQRIIRLSTGESEVFSLKEGFIPYGWEEEYQHDIYSFSKRGMDLARKITDDIIRQSIDPVYIDEIGPLVLQMKGLYDIFSEILGKRIMVYVSVRNSCLAHIIKFFNIRYYRIIEVIANR